MTAFMIQIHLLYVEVYKVLSEISISSSLMILHISSLMNVIMPLQKAIPKSSNTSKQVLRLV